MKRGATIRRALTLLVILAAPLLMIRMFQDSLLYYPEPMAQEDYLRTAATSGLHSWPPGGPLRGVAMPAKPDARATVAVLHGNGGLAIHRSYYAEALAPLGIRVVLLEYPKYGPRPGRLGEEAFVADAAESIRQLRQQSTGPLLLIGESLGAGVAAAVAKAAPEAIDALMLITPWDSLASVAGHHYPWLPVRAMLSDRYDSAQNLRGFDKPITLVIAERDEIIPPSFAERLAEQLGSKARRVVVAGAGHNDWADRLDLSWWQRETALLLPIVTAAAQADTTICAASRIS
jgi:hypothetical protein